MGIKTVKRVQEIQRKETRQQRTGAFGQEERAGRPQRKGKVAAEVSDVNLIPALRGENSGSSNPPKGKEEISTTMKKSAFQGRCLTQQGLEKWVFMIV